MSEVNPFLPVKFTVLSCAWSFISRVPVSERCLHFALQNHKWFLEICWITWTSTFRKGELCLCRFSPVLSLSEIGKTLCKEEAGAMAYRLSDDFGKHEHQEGHLFCRRYKRGRVPIERDAVSTELFETRSIFWVNRLPIWVQVTPLRYERTLETCDGLDNWDLREAGSFAGNLQTLSTLRGYGN